MAQAEDLDGKKGRVTFADITTMHVGGRIGTFVEPINRAELVQAVLQADAEGLPLCVVGGGSNILVGDQDFPGIVVRDARREISILDEAAPAEKGQESIVHVEAQAGANWDDFVAYTIHMGLEGVEGLSGIPGTVGASVVQNIGAYGQEVATTVESVQAWDRSTGEVVILTKDQMDFGYRTSLLKKSMYQEEDRRRFFPTPRYVVISVTFALRHSPTGVVGMGQLSKALQVEVGHRMPTGQIRDAVLTVRASKGMVEDPARYGNPWMKGTKQKAQIQAAQALAPTDPDLLHNRWSCGSFFVNPVLTVEQAAELLPADAPRFDAPLPVPDSGFGFGSGPDSGPSSNSDSGPSSDSGSVAAKKRVKTSAAWLIDHAGFPKGFSLDGRAALSSQHTLALTNHDHASSADLLRLSQAIQAGVKKAFGVDLVPEPVFIGLSDAPEDSAA